MTLSRSRFPWEQEALDFIYERFPAQDNYRAWANFEFIADDGSINEVDLLVACPQGVFLIEIKSNPGTLYGDALSWTWEQDARRKTVENPVLLANRKCKRLKSLLVRQRAFKKEAHPFIEPIRNNELRADENQAIKSSGSSEAQLLRSRQGVSSKEIVEKLGLPLPRAVVCPKGHG